MPDPALQEAAPFGEVLRRLRRERGYSIESLAYATRDADPGRQGISFGGIGHLERGQHQPKPATIELLAATLDVAPETFAEYRLALARRELDERAVGLDRALTTLAAIEPQLAALDGGAAGPQEPMREADAAIEEAEELARGLERKRSVAAADERAPGSSPGRAAESTGGRRR